MVFPNGFRQAFSLGQRRVQPEKLDYLPPEHPEAKASRCDLYWINLLMGNFRWLRREIGRLLESRGEPLRVLELGAGDGSLPASLHTSWHRRIRWIGLDRFSWRPPDRLLGWTQWMQGDLRRVSWPDCDVVVANLILHHFDDATLGMLAAKVPKSARWIFFCEPIRRSRSILLLMLLRGWLIHPVTWHDGVVSIGAGFRRGELPTAFVLPPDWKWRESVGWQGALRAKIHRGERG